MKLAEIEKLEQEINSEAFEAFYHIGQKLLKLKRGHCWEPLGLSGWSAYCSSGRIDYSKKHADRYIRASELRPRLGTHASHEFSVRQMEELCKCETDNDAKRVAKKAISLAKKTGERVTAKLIAEVRNGTDETNASGKALEDATLDKHLTKLADLLVKWRTSLEMIALEQWEDVEPVILTRVRTESANLTKFLRS